MSKTIKVKELLNMEELPEEIKINGTSFKRTEFNMLEALYANNNNSWWTNHSEILLDNEVEIIEDKQEIDIQDIVMMDLEKYGFDVKDEFAIDLICKINEIVQAVKQLDKKIKEK